MILAMSSEILSILSGQIAAQRCVLVVKQFKNKYKDSVDSYTEELVVRRELAENFCFYNEKYDSIEGWYFVSSGFIHQTTNIMKNVRD